MTPETSPSTHRRMRRTAVLTVIITVAPLGLVAAVITAESLGLGIAIAFGVVGSFLLLAEWDVQARPRSSLYALVVSTVMWALLAGLAVNPMGFFALALVGSLIIPRLERWRGMAVAGLAAAVAGIGALSFLTEPPSWETAANYVLMPAVLTFYVTGVVWLIERYWSILRDLERAQQAQADLAVMHERVRFAGDLHDIQGHTLHVVKLKVALARELVGTDDARAAHELSEVHALVGEAISETKQLAYAQRRLNLNAELENAKNLLEAAGIDVDVTRKGTVTEGDHELLGQVLRESTTNILRHAQATDVAITLTAHTIEVTNNGIAHNGDDLPRLHGLATLRERIALDGGELAVLQSDGQFVTRARIGPIAVSPGDAA